MREQEDYLTLTEAAAQTGISRVTLWRMVKEGRLRTYTSPRDRRAKLVKRAELDAVLRPVPRRGEEDARGKAAA